LVTSYRLKVVETVYCLLLTEMTQAENDRLDRIEAILESLLAEVRQTNKRLEATNERLEETNERLEQEIKRTDERFEKWDERFFQLARDTKNISVGLIVSAVVAILLSSIMK
jgi:septal ring factor EnvC (AmiA/AmiB activator)